jgi:putative transposase
MKTKPSEVVMETLNIRGMMKNKHLSGSIAEQGLYDFKMKLKYKCRISGIIMRA